VTIGENMRMLRKQRRLSQKELSNLSGVSDRIISSIERGSHIGSVVNVSHIAKVLGVRIQVLDPNLKRYSEKSLINEFNSEFEHDICVIVIPNAQFEKSFFELFGLLYSYKKRVLGQNVENEQYPSLLIIKNPPREIFKKSFYIYE